MKEKAITPCRWSVQRDVKELPYCAMGHAMFDKSCLGCYDYEAKKTKAKQDKK